MAGANDEDYEFLAETIRTGSRIDAEIDINPDGSHETDIYLNMSAGDNGPEAGSTETDNIETIMVTQEVQNEKHLIYMKKTSMVYINI